MFTHHCTACERRQLMFVRQISDVAPVTGGLEVSFTCWCGAEQTELLGAPAEAAESVTHAA